MSSRAFPAAGASSRSRASATSGDPGPQDAWLPRPPPLRPMPSGRAAPPRRTASAQRHEPAKPVVGDDRRRCAALRSAAAQRSPDRRHEVEPVRRERGVRTGPRRSRRFRGCCAICSIISAVGHDLGPPGLERLSEHLVGAGGGGEVRDDVCERDRLRRRRDPARADHRREPVDESDDRLERRAARARSPSPREASSAGRSPRSENLRGLGAAAQVARESGDSSPRPPR